MQNHLKMIRDGNYKTEGWAKLQSYCKLAASDGWDYAWMDTCFIDKTNLADTQEAINAMVRWYRRSGTCYGHLEGVDCVSTHQTMGRNLRSARWFQRGWTLQELLAPVNFVFVDQKWEKIGTREEFAEDVASACRMSVQHLMNFETQPVAVKLSWASHRKTTVEEDQAYSLLGLFNISIPLCYGEGELAFRRLLLELIKNYNDTSIFAFSSWDGMHLLLSLVWSEKPQADILVENKEVRDCAGMILAPYLKAFHDCGNIKNHTSMHTKFHFDNRGLVLNADVTDRFHFEDSRSKCKAAICWLDCCDGIDMEESRIAILLRDDDPKQPSEGDWWRLIKITSKSPNYSNFQKRASKKREILINALHPPINYFTLPQVDMTVESKAKVLNIYKSAGESRAFEVADKYKVRCGHEYKNFLLWRLDGYLHEVEFSDKGQFGVFLVLLQTNRPRICLVSKWESVWRRGDTEIDAGKVADTDAIQARVYPRAGGRFVLEISLTS